MLIYGELHEQARDPWFYETANVPDTLDGRFEMLILHIFLWINRMKQENNYVQAYEPVTKQLLEVLFDDMDTVLRELGVGDTGVSRRIKAMGQALYGRVEAYEDALESKEAIHEAIQKNVYAGKGDADDINLLQLYLGHITDHLNHYDAARLAEGSLELPSLDDLMEQA